MISTLWYIVVHMCAVHVSCRYHLNHPLSYPV